MEQTVVEFRVSIPVEYCENDNIVPITEARVVAKQALCRALEHFFGEGFPVDEPEVYAVGQIFVETLTGVLKDQQQVGWDLENPDSPEIP